MTEFEPQTSGVIKRLLYQLSHLHCPLRSEQCDQIGRYFKFLAAIFLTKLSQIFGDFLND